MHGYSASCAPVLAVCRVGRQPDRGLWDGDDAVGLVGFADRLAALLDTHRPGLQYANLAVRGKQIRDVLDDQLPEAITMGADLITVCVGMNDDPARPDSTARWPISTICIWAWPNRGRRW